MKKILNSRYFYAIAGPIAFIVVWGILAGLNNSSADPLVPKLFVSTPSEVFGKLWTLSIDDNLLNEAWETLKRLLGGFAISVAIGVPLGLAMGYFIKVYYSLEFFVDFLRSIPAAAIFPLFILIFGIGSSSIVAVVTYACLLIIVVNTIYGVRNVKELRIMSAKIMKLGRFDMFKKIILPESLTYIFAGLRIAISYGMVIVIFSEMFIGTDIGLGRRIIDAQTVYKISEMYAAIILTGLIGYGLNRVALMTEKRIIHWEGK
jgi:ABC-type nitrate/sulfonate/bicarbonate transport system permease component